MKPSLVSRRYRKGSIINVTVELLGSHQGQFDFDICPMFKSKIETNECFYQHHLPLADGSGYSYYVTRTQEQLRKVVVGLRLPLKLECTHCVLRLELEALNILILVFRSTLVLSISSVVVISM